MATKTDGMRGEQSGAMRASPGSNPTRRAIAAAATAGLCAMAAPASSQVPEKPKSLTINAFSGAWEKCVRQSLLPVFKQKTGIEVRLLTAQPPVAKLQAEGNDPELDVFVAGESDIKAAHEYGVLGKLDETLLTHLPNVYKSLLPEGTAGGVRYAVPFTVSRQGLIYNADKWSRPPDSWFDLVSDKTPGVVNVRVPDNQNTVAWLAIMASKLNNQWPTKVADYAGVIKLARDKLAPRLGALLPTAGAMQASFVNDPRSSLTVGFDSVAVSMAERYKLNLKWAEPKEGAYQVPTLAAITKTRNAYWSQVLVNHLLDPAVQTEFAECGHYAPTNRTVKLSERVASKVVQGDAQVDRLMRVQWDTIKPIAGEVGALFLQAVQSK